MKVELKKGKPKHRIDWSDLDTQILNLTEGNHIVVTPTNGKTPNQMRGLIYQRYKGVALACNEKTITITLKTK